MREREHEEDGDKQLVERFYDNVGFVCQSPEQEHTLRSHVEL